MILIVEFLFIVILVMVLFTFYRTEGSSAKKLLPHALVEECWSGKERRHHVRFKEDTSVDYIIRKRPHLHANGRTVDISGGGMKLLIDEKLPEGAIIDLKISVPGSSENTEIEGFVVWSEDIAQFGASGKRMFHAGIKFSVIKEPGGRHLVDYIRSIAQDVKKA